MGLKRVMAIAGGHVPLHHSFAGTWCFASGVPSPQGPLLLSGAPACAARPGPGPPPPLKRRVAAGGGSAATCGAAWRGSGPGRRSRLSSGTAAAPAWRGGGVLPSALPPHGGSSPLRLRRVLVPSRLPLTAPGSAQGTGSAPADPPAAPGSPRCLCYVTPRALGTFSAAGGSGKSQRRKASPDGRVQRVEDLLVFGCSLWFLSTAPVCCS